MKLDTGIFYATTGLFLDIVVGQALTGKPLHEHFGVELPTYLQRAEELSLALGWIYSLRTKNYTENKPVKNLNNL
jgi:hypothetical protein